MPRQNPVIIIAPDADLHAFAVMRALEQRGVPVECIDTGAIREGVRLTVSIGQAAQAYVTTSLGRTLPISDARAIWWRRPRPPERQPSDDLPRELFVRGEWRSFLLALELGTTTRWVNSPSAQELADEKPLQLAVARKLGLRVPETLISNDPSAVRAFCEQGKAIVYKRVAAGSPVLNAVPTRDLSNDDLSRLETLVNCPAVFQERIAARADIRVTAIGGAMYAAEVDSQSGSSPLDWRLDPSVAMSCHSLPHDIEERLRALLDHFGLVYGAIDLRLTPEGEYVFLEVNASGQYLFVELFAGLPLTDRMVDLLAEG